MLKLELVEDRRPELFDALVAGVREYNDGWGLGRELMQAAEQRAIERGCVGAQVDTLSFQGPRFYARLGFEVIGKVEGFPRGHDRYFLHKSYRNVSAAGRD